MRENIVIRGGTIEQEQAAGRTFWISVDKEDIVWTTCDVRNNPAKIIRKERYVRTPDLEDGKPVFAYAGDVPVTEDDYAILTLKDPDA